MASQAVDVIEEEAQQALTLVDILSYEGNIADFLDDTELTRIGQRVVEDVEIDEASRGDWLKRMDTALKAALQVKENKTFPWPKAANVKYPLLTVAAIQFQARAYPAIVDGSNLVKGRVLGPDPDGVKRDRADRIAQHMTWQLLYRMPDWEEETDKLLLMLPIVGCVFRKTWYDSVEQCNRSEIVSAEDFVINDCAKSIESAPRYTHILRYYPYEAREFILSGQWREIRLESEDDGNDEDALIDFYEQHRYVDLDGDGYPEPYVITTTTKGEIARIRPCFGVEDVKVRNLADQTSIPLSKLLEAQRPDLAGPIVKIERSQYFTKYSFIPSPDGSFYDIGFGALLGDLSATVDTLLNQMLDAATLQNAGGGFVGSGINIRGGNFRFGIGEWKRVDTTGGPLKDNFMAMPAPGPSPVSFNLLQMLITAAKEITAASDALTGGGPGTEQPTTLLARIEQAQKVISGILKRVHRSFGQDLRILRRLNRDYLDEEEYFQLNDAENPSQVSREDYQDDDLDVIPVSDPGQVSDMQKMARAQALFGTFNGDPLINQQLIRRDMLQALGAQDIQAYFKVPPPQPDPKAVADADKAATDKIAKTAAARASDAQSANTFMDAATKALTIGLTNDAADFAAAANSLTEGMNEDPNTPAGPGDIPGMAGEPGDGGILPVPGGPGGPVAGELGDGSGGVGLPGSAGAGGGPVPPLVPDVQGSA